MNSNTITQFQNFEPDEKEKKIVERALEDVEVRAPRWSYIKAKFQKKDDHFEAIAHVHSGQDFYKVEVSSKSMFALVGKLRSKVISQMKRWRAREKGKRFSRHVPNF